MKKESIESQIAYFGKVPTQLFSRPHPKRNPLYVCSNDYHMGYMRANLFVKEKSIP